MWKMDLPTVAAMAECAERYGQAHLHKYLARRNDATIFANVGHATLPSSPPVRKRKDWGQTTNSHTSRQNTCPYRKDPWKAPAHSSPPQAAQKDSTSSCDRHYPCHPDRHCYTSGGLGHKDKELQLLLISGNMGIVFKAVLRSDHHG